MSDLNSNVTVSKLIETIIWELKDAGIPVTYNVVLRQAIQVITEFNIYYIDYHMTVELDPKGKDYVLLPDGFIAYLKIGFLGRNNEIITYTKNDNIPDNLKMIGGKEYSWENAEKVDICIDPETVPAKPIIETGG